MLANLCSTLETVPALFQVNMGQAVVKVVNRNWS